MRLTNTGNARYSNHIYTYSVSTFAGKADSLGVEEQTVSTIRVARPCDILCNNDTNILYIKGQSGIDFWLHKLNTGCWHIRQIGRLRAWLRAMLEVDATVHFTAALLLYNGLSVFRFLFVQSVGTGLGGRRDSSLLARP